MALIIAQRYRWILIALMLLLLTLLSFGRILVLSFGWDDYTSLYFAVRNMPFPYPYYADHLRFMPLFHLFGLSSAPYYVVSLGLFFFTVLLLTFLVSHMTRRVFVAFTAAVIFIFSYVGSDSMYYVAEGLRHTEFLLVLLTTLLCYIFFRQKKLPWLYGVSFTIFLISTIVFPYRAFPVLPILVIFDLWTATKTENLQAMARRLFPFVLVWFFIFLVLPNLPGLKNFMGHIHPTNFLRTPIENHIRNFALTWLYLFLPHTFLARFQPTLQWIGLTLFLVTGFFTYRHRLSPLSHFTKISFWSLVIVLLSFTLPVNDYMITNHRYLFVARPFVAMFTAGIIFHLLQKENRRTLLAVLFICFLAASFFINILENTAYQAGIVDRRGPFAKKVIATIRSNVAAIHGKTLFFLDADDNEQRDRFVEALRVGTLPVGASLAVYYGTDHEHIEISDRVHCDIFQRILKTWYGEPVDIYYFYTDGETISLGPKERAFELCGITASEQ